MSFKQNDTNHIHHGNYEEFFILYMDNELSPEQARMVEQFLESNPDLRSELDLLMSTRLPLENYSISKEELLADQMQLNAIDEDLLLYIDNELPSGKQKAFEAEMAANPNLQLQHELLLKTRLDPSEQIACPNKEELYRRTTTVIGIRMWMRIAAAVAITAFLGIFYFTYDAGTVTPDSSVARITVPVQKQSPPEKKNEMIQTEAQPQTANTTAAANEAAARHTKTARKNSQVADYGKLPHTDRTTPDVAVADALSKPSGNRSNSIDVDPASVTTAVASVHKETLNNSRVTSALDVRNTIETPQTKTETAQTSTVDVAGKGSIKGFLRKATRLIEKSTGIDPTNEDGELLIGAVAVKLK